MSKKQCIKTSVYCMNALSEMITQIFQPITQLPILYCLLDFSISFTLKKSCKIIYFPELSFVPVHTSGTYLRISFPLSIDALFRNSDFHNKLWVRFLMLEGK